jgi:hypothetical protein
MDWLKSLMALLTSFFQNSTTKKVEEVKLAEVTEKAVVESIRASSNAQAVEQTIAVSKAVHDVEVAQTNQLAKEKVKPLNVQLDDQFGSDS